MLKVKVRPINKEDESFIIATWIRSVKHNFPYTKMRRDSYFKSFEKVIKYFLDLDSVKILVACNPDLEDQIFGYIVYDETLHFAYVKDVFRKMGLFNKMFKEANIEKNVLRNWTCNTNWMVQKYNLEFIPFFLEV